MKQTILALAGLAAWSLPLAADPVSDGVQGTISAQIDAFRSGDFTEAFGYAATNIQTIFGNTARFQMMVERGYPMVVAPAEIQYRALRAEGPGQVQRVLLRDASGIWQALDYFMVQEDGVWRIAGVELIGAPEVGA